MADRPTLLVTRPQEGAARFVAAFRARFGADWPVVVSPLTGVEPTGADVSGADVLVFTSEQAVRFAGHGRRAYCVGARTAAAARAAGFVPVTGPGDARGLCAEMVAHRPAGRIVHARGAEAALSVVQVLAQAGLSAREVVVYRQTTLPPSPAAQAVLAAGGPVLAPVFSPRGAARLAGVAGQAVLWVAAISAAAARPLAPARTEIAQTPDMAGVLDAAARLVRDQAG